MNYAEDEDIISIKRRESFYITQFTERSHELSSIVSQISKGFLVSPADAAKFSLELRNYHAVSGEFLCRFFHSNLRSGLSEIVAKFRLRQDGQNIVSKATTIPKFVSFILCFVKGFSPLLWVSFLIVFLTWKPLGAEPYNVYNLALAITILIVIIVTGLFNFYQQQKTEKVLASFKSLIPQTAVVLRDGVLGNFLVKDIVQGDVIQLQSGCRVPADLRILSSNNLSMDKSMLSGENEPLKLTSDAVSSNTTMLESRNMAFMGCTIVDGEGYGLVVATGPYTQLSLIALSVSTVKGRRGTLQADINRFVKYIVITAITTAVVMIMIWSFYLRPNHSSFMPISSMLTNVVAVFIAFVPEGLPLALSLGLTLIAYNLCKKFNVIVKELHTIETLGSMSMLCSDKTGTLTMNKMSVTNLLSAVSSYDSRDLISQDDCDSNIVKLLHTSIQVCVLCNDARFNRSPTFNPNESTSTHNEKEHQSDWKRKVNIEGGNAIERALLEWSEDMLRHLHRISSNIISTDDLDESKVEDHLIISSEVLKSKFEVIAKVPFTSFQKFSAVVVRLISSSGAFPRSFESTSDVLILVKGAPEVVLVRCRLYLDADGNESLLNEGMKSQISERIDSQASKGERVIALAFLKLSRLEYHELYEFKTDPTPNFPLIDLTFVSTVSVSDSPRPQVKEAISNLKNAGIKIMMITGDSANTAIAVAIEVGILSHYPREEESKDWSDVDYLEHFNQSHRNIYDQNEDIVHTSHFIDGTYNEREDMVHLRSGIVIKGEDLAVSTSSSWEFIFKHAEIIFARTTPEQKLQIVKESQKAGYLVGVTGDGVNDSPALKRADVGIAMNSGSEVAKDAASMILLNDDFTCIVHGVEEGRLIFQNLRKVIAYGLAAGNWSELLPVLATFILGMPQPLSSFLMIIISCLTDVFAGVALTYEPPEREIMLDRPRDITSAPLVDLRIVAYSCLFYGMMESFGAFFLYFYYMSERDPVKYSPTDLIGAWTWGYSDTSNAEDMMEASRVGSSIFFVALITSQWGHLLSVRRRSPYFVDAILNRENSQECLLNRLIRELKLSSPRRPIVIAILLSAIVSNLVIEIPELQIYCFTGHVPAKYWGIAISFSLTWFLIGETYKWLHYFFPKTILSWIAW